MRTPSRRSSLVRLLCERRAAGAEVLEYALVFPLLLTLLLGIFYFGRAFSVYQAITRAAREGTRNAVLTTCAQCGNTVYTSTEVQTLFVNPALAAVSLDPAKVQNYTQTTQWLDPGATPPQQCGVAISFDYPFQFNIPFTSLRLSTINIGTQVQMRLENQPIGGTCP